VLEIIIASAPRSPQSVKPRGVSLKTYYEFLITSIGCTCLPVLIQCQAANRTKNCNVADCCTGVNSVYPDVNMITNRKR
jgi:hypothetical protein